ncbi:TPA: hypothetical protein ACQYCS_002897 [Vibrio parahaemolyticus]|uniref:hypothetical protein n=1 Tax=Vibrio parahaemolyticus TaxID=670 RepID=UPI001D165566|nr:hypothetical protein [Vibrio parahaemolyticus]MCC3791214.1 hypothetical protein [Vibrio parahaemolyticus]HCE4630769.1 hypothetical protein [Vibrio parahaemolyticus]
MSINISDLTNALTKVEHVHKVQLENVHQFFKTNEVLSIETFSQIIACDSIDERFKTIDKAFSPLGDVKTYLLEASYLVS